MNKLNKEEYTVEKIRQEAEQYLINIKNKEIRMQQIREEHEQLELKRDILINILKIKINILSTQPN